MSYINNHKKIILLAFTFIVVMILSFVFIADNFRKKEKVKDQEEIKEEKPIVETETSTELALTPEKRLELIKFLLENYHFSAFTYDDVSEITMSYLAHKLIDWDKNPFLSDKQKQTIITNYQIEEWQLEQYINYKDVEDYYFKMTGKLPLEKDSSSCMKYIEEYDIYIHTDGHGLWAGSPEYLVFGDESGKSEFYYIEKVIDLKNGTYTFEVQQYDLGDYHYSINIEESKKILEDFIYGKINTSNAYLIAKDKTTYLMKKENDQWQFIAHLLKASQ